MKWRVFIGFLTIGLVGSPKETSYPMIYPMISRVNRWRMNYPMRHPMTRG